MPALDAGRALCAPFLAQLPVTGLSISVLSGSGAQSTVGASDAVAVRLEELQFQLGEGPTREVMRTGRPVLVPDLTGEDAKRGWPVFGEAAIGTGARALFSLPMFLGVAAVGVVSLYSLVRTPPWSSDTVRAAVLLVGATSRPAVELATSSASEDGRPAGPSAVEMRREVHQAGGMLMVQLDCGIDEAMARLRAHAFATARPIDEVARDVVSGSLTFEATGA